MDNPTRYSWQTQPIPLSMLMLSILVLFTVLIFNAPYTGFYFNPSSGEVFDVEENSAIQVGDILIKVGDTLFNDYDTDSTQPLFPFGLKKGDITPITVLRNNIEQTILFEMPGFHIAEFRGRLFNIWWLAYIFWLFGVCVEAFIRPREIRWWLLLFANHLTGLWLMLGSFSSWHLWGGSILFHAITWLLLPIYLHLNWIFPKPLFTFPKISVILIYTISVLLFFGELMQALPPNFYTLALITALSGSVILQIVHFIWQPEQRKQIKSLIIATIFASLPLITIGILSLFGKTSSNSAMALLFFLFIPVVYLYLILRDRLGGLEARANLFISIFIFLILVGTFLIILIHLTALLPAEISALLNFIIPLLSATVSIQYFPRFQKYIEKRFLGIKLDNQILQQEYIKRIVTCTSLNSLLQLLEEETFPSLFIRQYMVVQNTNGNLKALLTKNVSASEMPDETVTKQLHERSGKFIPNVLSDDWMRLILPLQVGDSTLGFLLLGQRDPDDLYHQSEIPILQSIANQTAVALSNILYAEQLKQMYQVGMQRYEAERSRLGRDLHDRVLNVLGDLHKNLGEDVSTSVQTSYQQAVNRLREIINDLRPPMLMYGLALALQGLAESVMQKTDDQIKVIIDLQSTDERLPENIEVQLFWIVYEACENSVRHAKASCIEISGSLSSNKAELFVEDNGIGFDMSETWNLNNIIANHHFGLVGMLERAHVIGAKLNIEPKPHTKVHVVWDVDKI